MKGFFLKPYRWAILFSLLLIGSTIFVLLDTFVIPQSIQKVVTESGTETQNGSQSQADAIVTATSYQDDNIKITIETVQKYNSTIYIADIQVTDASYLKTAFAGDTYGRNIKDTTSDIALANNAILAINGDYYGFRDNGYVLRNGVLYRSTARKAGDDDALVIDAAGNFSIIHESQVSAKSLGDSISQILSFGPSLIENSKITVSSNSEVSQSMTSNPRTAIGQISPLHYVIIVSDGRTSKSAGLSLLELAQVFEERGCITAYNLDGGGSSTMYFNGKVINNPTDGKTTGEREVSDIVYFGY
ncbi:phosphodiester glycosidase family protein [[Clostridium] fimetarium]|uniref:Exopolysaccharide biosynthesis protein n=1 Tax=[Clostridium] fimetarium TaxID=99656 RepID=A0A1I0RX32_9FIRM|nr:phosphodiester glycosidase family protein [[Clostridium] fimetarium]SEW46107.1 Exopolysaccharide biosynthesis protein [[Clostridium] fimetarium]